MSKKTKGVKKIINNLKKFKTTQQLDKMIKNYEQKKSKGSKSLFYLTDYDKKTGKFKGDQRILPVFWRAVLQQKNVKTEGSVFYLYSNRI